MPTSPNSRAHTTTNMNTITTSPAKSKANTNANTNTPSTTRTRVPSSSQSKSSISAPSSPSTAAPRAPTNSLSSQNSPYSHHTHSQTPSQQLPPPTPVSPVLSASPSSPRPLDMKRLLAKPAPPYARAHQGSGSESEGTPGGGHSFSDGGGISRIRRERDREKELDRTMREISFDKGAPLDLSLEQPASGETLSRSRSRTRSEGTPEKVQDVDNGKLKEKEKRPRNVLRRRPSTMTVSTPSSTTTSHTTNTTTAIKSKPHTSTASSPHLTPTQTPNGLRSPLPPLSPRSPLTPSILPTGSPSISPAASAPASPGHSARPTTAPSPRSPGFNPSHSQHQSQTHAQSSSNTKIDKVTNTTTRRGGMSRSTSASASVPTPQARNLAYGHSAVQGKAPRTPNSQEMPSVHVTDVDPGSMARRVRGHPFPSSPIPSHSSSLSPSPSPAPSRSHSPSFRSPHHHPQHLSSAVASTRVSSAPSSRSSSRTRPSPPEPDTAVLTPAGAVVAAYKRQAAMREAAAKVAEGDYADDDAPAPPPSKSLLPETARKKYDSLESAAGRRSVSVSPSESGMSRVSLGLGEGGSGAGFDVIERVVVRGQGGSSAAERPRTSPTDEKKNVRVDKENQERDGEGSPRAPYYTVFGSSSGRVVAVGGPEDHHHLSWDVSPLGLSSSLGSLGRRSTVAAGNAAQSNGGLKTLTKKVSGRWRRGASGTGGENEREFVAGQQRGVSLSGEREREIMRGRPSLQERPSTASGAGVGRSGKRMTMAADRRSLRLSIDKFPEEVRVLGRETGKALELSKEKEHPVLKTTKGGSPASGSPASGNTPTASPNTISGGGSKIWKLMKRISTGGLREKYTHQDAEAPPVPALPKEYAPAIKSAEEKNLPSTPKGLTSRHSPSNSAGASTAGFGKAVRKKASVVLGVGITNNGTPTKPLPSPNHLPRSPLPPQTTASAARPSPPTSNARPSTTTRSSSPNSSDVASTRFFSGSGNKQSASAHSSTSSLLFEGVPPMPKMNIVLGQHIIPPSELGRMHSDEGHGGSEESSHQQHQVREQRQSQLHPSHQHQKTPTRSQSQSQSGLNNPLKKLKLVLPPSTSPTKQPRKSDDWMIVHTPAAELVSLPLPPRRAHHAQQNRIRSDANTPTPNTSWSGRSVEVPEGDDEHDQREKLEWEQMWGDGGDVEGAGVNGSEEDEAGSPVIPSFSTAGAINTFSPRRTSTDTRRSRPSLSPASTSGPASSGSSSNPQPHHHPQQLKNLQNYIPLEPPPRPSRSTQRPSPPSGGSKSMPTSPINSTATTHVPVPIYASGAPTSTNSSSSNLGTKNSNRRSTGEHSTTSTATITNLRRRSSSYLTNTPPSSPPRTMMFREIGASGPGVVLSEQEKAARWDDLLERSARAGGTLHLDMGGKSGEHGLRSDRLRFSEISEVVSL